MTDKTKNIIIASDHAGYKLKGVIKKLLEQEEDYEVEDVGPAEYVEEDDYPDYGAKLAQRVNKTGFPGIAICGSAAGICAVMNKHKGINAGVGFNIQAAESMRSDDNTNVLCLAGQLTTQDHAKAIVRRWLETPFSNADRHVRRLKKLKEIEDKNMK